MRKAILVIDMPSCCNECSLMWKDEYSYYCPVKCDENKSDLYSDYITFHRKPDWCPLKPTPQFKNSYTNVEESLDWYQIGYNQCLSEILSK